MDNPWNEVSRAVEQARNINAACDRSVQDMATLLVGRLHHIKSYQGTQVLRKLKKELRNFDMVSGSWKE